MRDSATTGRMQSCEHTVRTCSVCKNAKRVFRTSLKTLLYKRFARPCERPLRKTHVRVYIYGLSEFLKSDFLEIAQVLSKHLPFAKIANTGFPESISKANSYGFVQKPWTRISRFPLLILYSNLFLPKWDLDNEPAPADPYPEAPARGR